jgi:hypothetical protein
MPLPRMPACKREGWPGVAGICICLKAALLETERRRGREKAT